MQVEQAVRESRVAIAVHVTRDVAYYSTPRERTRLLLDDLHQALGEPGFTKRYFVPLHRAVRNQWEPLLPKSAIDKLADLVRE